MLAKSSVSRSAHKCLIFCLSAIFCGSLAIQIGFLPTRCLGANFIESLGSYPHSTLLGFTMSSKKQKLSSKKSQKIKEPSHDYDHEKFVNESGTEKFSLIYENGSFIKEKGFHHPKYFFRKTIANKGWSALCQPLRPVAMMVVRKFYAYLVANVLKKVLEHGVMVDFSAKSIKEYFNLEPVNSKAYDRHHETPNYPEVLRMLTNGRG